MKVPQWVVWDLGGVVIDLDFRGMMDDATEKFNIDKSELLPLIREEFNVSPSNYSLTEKAVAGLITKKDYIYEIKSAISSDISEREIESLLKRILVGEKDETVLLIKLLSQRGFRQACMSNIDQTHWEKIQSFPNVDNLFEKKFLSFEHKVVKPNADAFFKMLEFLGCGKDDIVFIDDREDNVKSANDNDIDAVLFKNHTKLLEDFTTRGLLN
ncbi:HAD family hydrolase [Halomonas sp. SpR8]|uniref:HAD family hydrolase n=1 Tax=Halomonas sp. SpR8 TaxID=3050463 RepID=UPI0027E4D037|nr:HAD family hydrolase [Halomonas sp. SpR8]MDQ7728940.1 HAD hydrolase-like protein [Halomonas sp. SpR8]